MIAVFRDYNLKQGCQESFAGASPVILTVKTQLSPEMQISTLIYPVPLPHYLRVP